MAQALKTKGFLLFWVIWVVYFFRSQRKNNYVKYSTIHIVAVAPARFFPRDQTTQVT